MVKNQSFVFEISYLNSTNNMHEETGQEQNNSIKVYEFLVKLYSDIELMREIFIYLGSFITVLGFILNTLCIFIFYKSKIFRNSSFPYYVYIISSIDTVNILLRFAVPQFFEKNIRNTLATKFNISGLDTEKYDSYTSKITSEYDCSVYLYIYNSFTLISVWLMVAVSLERFLVIKFALQTKYMIKLRAFLILLFIFLSVFSFNIFDLTPGLYIKPQWYANLTLLCEIGDLNDTESIYKRIGSFTFNLENYFQARLFLQTIMPFLLVLIFNSMIIYNFKRIKLAARGRGKSNSIASVNSFSGNCSVTNLRATRSLRPKRHKNVNQNKFQLQIPERSPDFSLSSRSPSPNLSIPNTPITPTSLVSALNLVPTKNSYLMPPEQNNGCMTPTSTNSSANLSIATTTNLTSSTCVNHNVGQSNEKLAFIITSVLPNKKNVGTTTTNSTRVSFKRRVSKLRLNRETDIMLIVLSFIILFSQFPFSFISYLVYYRNILTKSAHYSMFFPNARYPMVLYIMRLLEMLYFSLNFFFYITLSPSLRKELRKNLPNKFQFITTMFSKFFILLNGSKSDSNLTQKEFKKCDKQELYGDYLSKMRSVSPVQRPNSLSNRPKKCKKKFTNIEYEQNMCKNKNNSHDSSNNNKIKIVIDNMYDDEGEVKVQDSLISIEKQEPKENISLVDNRKRMFNFSSPSFLNSLDTKKSNPENKFLKDKNMVYL